MADIQKIVEILLRMETAVAQQGVQSINKELGLSTASALKFGAAAGVAMKAVEIAINATLKALKQIPDTFKEAVAQAVRFETSALRLGLALGNLNKGVQVLREVENMATKMGVSLDDAGKGAEVLARGFAKTPEKMKTALQYVINLSAYTGDSIENTSQQIERMWLKGQQGSRIFARTGILEMMGFQEGVQYSVKESRDILVKAMGDTTSAINQAGGLMADTWTGQVQQLENSWDQFKEEIVSGGAFEILKRGLQAVINLFKELSNSTESWVGTAKSLLTGLASFIAGVVVNGLRVLLLIIAQVIDVFRQLNLVWQGLKILWASLMETMSGISGIQTIINGLATGFLYFSKVVNQVVGFIKKLFTGLLTSITDLSIKIIQKFRSISEAADQMSDFWGLGTTGITEALFELEQGLVKVEKTTIDLEKTTEEANKATIDGIEIEIQNRNEVQQAIDREGEANKKYYKKQREDAALAIEDHIKAKTAVQMVRDAFDSVAGSINKVKGAQVGLNKAIEQGTTYADLFAKLSENAQVRSLMSGVGLSLKIQEVAFQRAYVEGVASFKTDYIDRRTKTYAKYLAWEIEATRRAIDDEQDLEKQAELIRKKVELEKTSNEKIIEFRQDLYKQLQDMAENQPTLEEMGFQNIGADLADMFSGKEIYDAQAAALDAALRAAEDAKEKRLTILEGEHAEGLIEDEEYYRKREEIIAFYEGRAARIREKEGDMWITRVKSNATMAQEAFSNLYEATGKKVRAFFYLQKAAAIAETMISTYEGAQKAYTSMAGIPYVGPGLGVAMAAIAVAGGLARIAIISSQNMAKGGEVGGHSPSPTADNIPANLTAGEFVHPVSSVQYYGPGVMEAMRRQIVPREIFSRYALQARRGHTHYAMGGMVVPEAKKEQQQQVVNITNITSPDEINQYLQTKPGEETILNVVSKYSRQVRAIIAQ